MLNPTLFKLTLRSNLRLWIIFTLIMCVLQLVFIAVFDPTMIEGMGEMFAGTPFEQMLSQTTFLGMLSQTFYAIHGVILPLIYVIMTANSLLASQVDRGSMAYLLSTPMTRTTLVMTQAAYLILAIAAMFALQTLIGVVSIHLFQSDTDIAMRGYYMLNVGLFLLMFAISGISFFFSSLFNLSKNSLALGAGIPLAFFIFQLMSTVDASLADFRYLTLNALFDTAAIVADSAYEWKFALLGGIGAVLYVASLVVFKRKDLPL